MKAVEIKVVETFQQPFRHHKGKHVYTKVKSPLTVDIQPLGELVTDWSQCALGMSVNESRKVLATIPTL